MESMKKDLLTIELKLDNPTSTQLLENYAYKVKTNRNETQTKCTTDIRSGTRQNGDPRNILLIKTNQKFRDSIEIKKAFASIYPNKKSLYVFITARGSIHLEFTTPEKADCVLQGWRAELFGGDSSARRASDRNEQHSAVIRGVPLEESDSDMTSAPTDNFPGVRIRRFVKSDGKSLHTVKRTFPSKAQFDKATTDGIFIDHLYYLLRLTIGVVLCVAVVIFVLIGVDVAFSGLFSDSESVSSETAITACFLVVGAISFSISFWFSAKILARSDIISFLIDDLFFSRISVRTLGDLPVPATGFRF